MERSASRRLMFPISGGAEGKYGMNNQIRLQGFALRHSPAVFPLHNSNLKKGTSHERDQELSAGRYLPCDFGTTHWLRARWHQTGDCPSEQHRQLLQPHFNHGSTYIQYPEEALSANPLSSGRTSVYEWSVVGAVGADHDHRQAAHHALPWQRQREPHEHDR